MVGDHNGFDCKNFQTDEVHSIYGVMGFDVSDSWGQVPELPMDDGCFSPDVSSGVSLPRPG